MRYVNLAFVLLLCQSVAHADEALSPEMVKAVKAATVFVKIKSEGLAGSGSGFVVQTEGDTAYIVTNRHVVQPKVAAIVIVPERRSGGSRSSRNRYRGGLPGFPQPPMPAGPPGFPTRGQQDERPHYSIREIVREFKNVNVTVVFRSGSQEEESVPGKLAAVDPDEDLAIVKVSGVKQLPKAIEYRDEPQLSETMPIYVFGFPLGEELATSKRSPAITVGKGTVSSLRTDDEGKLALVQLDAALNHGNSGGPVVDAKGRLVGVAVARITEADSQNLSLAVPSQAVTRLLQGRVGKAVLATTKDSDDCMLIHVTAALIDPLDKIKSANFYYLSAAAAPDKHKPSDPLDALTGCHTLELKLQDGVASGTISVNKGVTAVSLLHQVVSIDEGGTRTIANSAVDRVALAPPVVKPPAVVQQPQPVKPNTAIPHEKPVGPSAGSIGIHFIGGGSAFRGTGGVVPMNNWNNEADFSFNGSPLVDNSGANSGATFSLNGATSVWATGSGNELLNGYVASNGFNPMTLTINGIPYARYSMYVYVGDGTLGNQAKVTVNGTSYCYTPTGGSQTYAEVTNTSADTHQLGNYVKVKGLSGASQTVSIAGTTQQYSGLCSVEIVNTPAATAGANLSPAAPPASRDTGPAGVRPAPQQRPRTAVHPRHPTVPQAGNQEQIFGGRFGPQFHDAAPANGMLVGFEVGLGKWGPNDVVSALRPIYVDEDRKEVLGEQHGTVSGQIIRVKAKPGYAVGAITVKALAAIDGFSLTFAKIDKDRLDPADTYESDWVGGKGGVAEKTISGSGSPAIGIIGHTNGKDCSAVGLVFAPAKGGG